jgi:AcrR family transcriptional regulator
MRNMLGSEARRRRTQAERTEASSNGLLGAALELVAERGLRNTSLQAIGERAGYSRGLVSHRFGSKEGLLKELVPRMMEQWAADVRDPAVGNRVGIAAIRAVAQVHRRAIEQTPHVVRALYRAFFESLIDMPELRGALGQMDRRLRERSEQRIREGIANGTVRPDVDVSAEATLFLAALRGITLQWLVDPEAVDLERVYAALDDWIQRGLSA